jgi:hypothetical protein
MSTILNMTELFLNRKGEVTWSTFISDNKVSRALMTPLQLLIVLILPALLLGEAPVRMSPGEPHLPLWQKKFRKWENGIGPRHPLHANRWIFV